MTAIVLALLLQFAFVANATALDLPPLKTTISDFAGMFPPASLEELEHRLHRFATETANHVAILTVKTLDGAEIDTLAQQAFNRLPLSDTERNKTVLLVIARAEHEVGFHAGASLQHLLPQPATREKLREQVALYINGLRPDLGIHGAVHYLFRALRGDVHVGSQSADEELEEISLSGRGAGAIFALFIGPFLAFFVGGLWGVYATQFGVQRWPRLGHGRDFWRRHGQSRHNHHGVRRRRQRLTLVFHHGASDSPRRVRQLHGVLDVGRLARHPAGKRAAAKT